MGAADLLLDESDGIGLAGIDGQRRAELRGKVQLVVVDVDGDHVQAHGLGVLDRQMAETADAGDHHPVAGLGVRDLEPLVDGHAGAEDRRDLDEGRRSSGRWPT